MTTLEELTPRGSGAVSVLALVGPGAATLAAALAGRALAPGVPALARLTLAGEALDEALVLVRDDARVELHVHGSVALVARLRAGLGLAPPEPPRGAEARAARLVGGAPGEDGARLLLDQAGGALRRRLATWAALDDAALSADAAQLARDSAVARHALEPARVVLVGPTNAGKSTLFNALVGSERVVVDAAAGTTRDLVVERATLGAWPVDLVDTAGERELPGAAAGELVEREGQRLARHALEGAALVLRLVPPGDATAAARGPRERVLHTQGDRPGAHPAALRARDEPAAAARAVAEAFRAALGLPERAWSPGRGLAFDAATRSLVQELGDLAPAAARTRAARWCDEEPLDD